MRVESTHHLDKYGFHKVGNEGCSIWVFDSHVDDKNNYNQFAEELIAKFDAISDAKLVIQSACMHVSIHQYSSDEATIGFISFPVLKLLAERAISLEIVVIT